VKRRADGEANIEEHPKGSGRYRVRARINGTLKTVGSGLSAAEASELAAGYTVVRNADVLREGLTLAQYGVGFLNRREEAGVRGIKKDRYYWGKHVAADELGSLPVATLGRRDVVEWRDRRTGVAHRTRVKLLNLLRVALTEAVDRELLKANPALEVRVHKSGAARAKDDLEGVLTPAEQQKLIAAVPERERATVVFALCTGLRQAEQWWLHWSDVGMASIVVSRSSGGLPPKSGKPREVHLLPAAAAALRSLAKGSGIIFTAAKGGRRQEGKSPRGWSKWVTAAGIKRHIRWHDLRHTCATALLAGWWGRKWSLDEVCSFLGHHSVTVTERYARKLNETQRLAVSETHMLGFEVPLTFPVGKTKTPKTSEPIPGLEPGTCALRKHTDLESDSAVTVSGVPTGEHEEAEAFQAALAEHLGALLPSDPERVTESTADHDGETS